jgi:hypothetical protein
MIGGGGTFCESPLTSNQWEGKQIKRTLSAHSKSSRARPFATRADPHPGQTTNALPLDLEWKDILHCKDLTACELPLRRTQAPQPQARNASSRPICSIAVLSLVLIRSQPYLAHPSADRTRVKATGETAPRERALIYIAMCLGI